MQELRTSLQNMDTVEHKTLQTDGVGAMLQGFSSKNLFKLTLASRKSFMSSVRISSWSRGNASQVDAEGVDHFNCEIIPEEP